MLSTRTSAAAPAPTSLPPVDQHLIGTPGGDSDLFPDSGNGGYQVDVWRWDLAISDDLTTIEGSVEVTATAEHDVQRFSFDARDLEIESVVVDGVEAAFALIGPELVVTASQPISESDVFVVEIAYEATPSTYSPPGVPFPMGWDVDAGSQLVTHGFPGARASWVPSNEETDDARYIISITVPDGFEARAGGHLESTTHNGDTTTFVWDTRREVAFPLLTIGRYQTHTIDTAGIAVELSLPAGSGTGRRDELADELPEIVAFLEQLYGPFPFDRLNISTISNRPFALAGPMHVVVDVSGPDHVLIHEVAHQWLGASVSQETDESGWLFEGAATYTANVLWPEFQSGIDVAQFAATLASEVPSATRPLDEVDDIAQLLDSATYRRGALLYHALRIEIGDDAFFSTLASFTDRHAHSTATPQDLQAVAEVAADRNLGDFFDAWISRPEVPDYTTSP